jgi:hypothetical protein
VAGEAASELRRRSGRPISPADNPRLGLIGLSEHRGLAGAEVKDGIAVDQLHCTRVEVQGVAAVLDSANVTSA